MGLAICCHSVMSTGSRSNERSGWSSIPSTTVELAEFSAHVSISGEEVKAHPTGWGLLVLGMHPIYLTFLRSLRVLRARFSKHFPFPDIKPSSVTLTVLALPLFHPWVDPFQLKRSLTMQTPAPHNDHRDRVNLSVQICLIPLVHNEGYVFTYMQSILF